MFNKARLKLTAWYLLIIMFISLSFSLVIYRVLTREFERFARTQRFRIERRFEPPKPFALQANHDPELIEEVKERLKIVLILINAGILLLAGGTGYLLAGRTLRPIKEVVDEQNRFISDASHELRTPLTALKTSMEVSMRAKEISLVQVKKLISENIIEVNKLQSLCDQLLRLAQYEKPNGNLKFENLALKKIIEESIRKIQPIAKEKKISIQKSLDDVELKGAKYSLIDLFVILLDNAIKYSPPLSRVIVKTVKIDNSIEISVIDRGIGIDQKELPHIFDRFYRADRARTKISAGGYGLGLSIAKKIVEIHKGSIKVNNNLKKGATIKVTLPIK